MTEILTRVGIACGVLAVVIVVQIGLAIIAVRRVKPLSDEWRRGLNYDKEGMKP